MTGAALTASSPRRIRQRNERAALQALHRHGALTKADLARHLQLNRSSSGHIIAALQADGLVRERDIDLPDESRPLRVGRPGTRIELVSEAACFVGVEIGVAHIAVAEVDLAANLTTSAVEPFAGSRTDAEGAVRAAVDLALRTVPPDRLARCEGFGVAAPAQMDGEGRVRTAPLLGWSDVGLAEAVGAALPLRVPVAAENDANAFAIGATYRHPGFRAGVTLFLVMESGIGGGIVIDGRLFRGGHGLAGEIGHLLVRAEDGSLRALEDMIGLDRTLAASRSAATPCPDLPGLLVAIDRGDPAARAVALEWAHALAYGLVQACRVVDPDRIVLGGSLAELHARVAHTVLESMRDLQETSFPLPAIAASDVEGSGPAYGAACILHQRYLSQEARSASADGSAG
jgi:predicted NBD/HSP70 family sugar kinase